MTGTVLISTHDLKVAGGLREAFREGGYRVDLVTPGEELSSAEDPVLLILTGEVESPSAGDMAAQMRAAGHVPVYAVVAGDEDQRRRVSRELGLDEAFAPPVDSEVVLLLGNRLIQRRRLQEVTGIVGETDAIRQALERVVQIAPVHSTVLLTGESGTGKELVARGVHALSPRRHKPFIAVNLAALSETLLESELFGHEKGSFTGAIDSRKGLFELAHSGTIFLDEIGEMPLSTQTKLLRVLEEREFHRVGGEKTIRVDVRIITATNQDLRRLVAVGGFRRDLYFRLNVLHIELPPLRERREDIPLLVTALVEEACQRHDRSFAGLSPEAMEILTSHYWPGNVRELKNLVESMVVLSPGRMIGPDDIPEEIRSPSSGTGLLPMTAPGLAVQPAGESGGIIRPELEFVFRTLVDLRVDMDDLRRDFEEYRRTHDFGVPVSPLTDRYVDVAGTEVMSPADSGVDVAEVGPVAGDDVAPSDDDEVVYRSGMTMGELEREAIRRTLNEVNGNRRKAAEQLGIGERTLYRKIRKYGLED